MSLLEKLETVKLEVAKDEISQEIARLDQAKSALLLRGQKISGLLGSLLESTEDQTRKQELDVLFFSGQEDIPVLEDGRKVNIKSELKGLLSDLDLKFSGGKKGAKPNRELAIENIFKHLESLKTEIYKLEKEQQDKYLNTSEGRDEFEREQANKEKCTQEILIGLSRLDDIENINQLDISPRHLELAGVYGVELTQSAILNEWKKMASELLLHNNFSDSKEKIRNFQKYQPVIEDLADYNDQINRVKRSAANLKSLEDQAVLTLADIIAKNPEIKQRFHRYGVMGASLNPDIRKKLAAYDDLSEDQIAESPAALAYEYIHHLLHVSAGSDYGHENHLNGFANLFRFNNSKENMLSGADVFGQKYLPEYFELSGHINHDLEFLLQLSGNLEKLISSLQENIKSKGGSIDPRSFLASFGTENYGLIKELPKMSDFVEKTSNFPKEYSDASGPLTKKYYQDEAIFNQFDTRSKQLAEKLDMILSIRWLEAELNQKYSKNPEVWGILNNKIKLVNYLKFLEQNKAYHAKQLIGVNVDKSGKIELLDMGNRQAEYNLQVEFRELENDYKDYLKNEITGIASEINRTKGKIFKKNDKLSSLNERLGTCQVLNSYKLLDRIYGRISSSSSSAFKEASLTPKELEVIKDFVSQGLDNLKEQELVRDRYRASEKDLARHQEKLDAKFLSDYPDFVHNVFTYEALIADLKLVNVGLSSLLKEKYSTLIKNFSIKSKKYKELIDDYNRKYNREGAHYLIPTIDFRGDLADYL